MTPVEDWRIIEENSFSHALSQCGDIQLIDEALAFVEYGLRRNPLMYPLVPGLSDIHFAKTRLRVFRGQVVPALRMWFRPDAVHRVVFKLYVEPCPPDEMKLGTNFWNPADDDGLPF